MSHTLVRDGNWPTKHKGMVQKYLCRDCKKHCSGLPALRRRHASAATIPGTLSTVSMGHRWRAPQRRSLGVVTNSTTPPYTDEQQRAAPLCGAYQIRPWREHRRHCDEVHLVECDKTKYFWDDIGLGRHEKILKVDAEYYTVLGNGAYLFTSWFIPPGSCCHT